MEGVMEGVLANFLEEWEEDDMGVHSLFVSLHDHLQGMAGRELSFKGRPGISYSLRAKHPNQQKRDLFVLVDVIDDEPEERWLSICFYADSLLPEQIAVGDVVPGGLGGEDACCFDVGEAEEDTEVFMKACLDAAWAFAAKA